MSAETGEVQLQAGDASGCPQQKLGGGGKGSGWGRDPALIQTSSL